MTCSRLIGCLLTVVSLPGAALSKPSIQTNIIPGGEVSINEVKARYDGQSIAVSGTGFEVFPGRTCGYAEIAFVDANGRISGRTLCTSSPTRTVRACGDPLNVGLSVSLSASQYQRQ